MKNNKLKYSFIVIIILFYMASLKTGLFAEKTVKFFIGNVKVKYTGKIKKAKLGSVIPDSAVIITGKNSRVSIYDDKNGNVYNIKPMTRVKASQLVSSLASRSVWDRIFKKNSPQQNITTTAAIRGNEEGEVKVDWSYSDDEETSKINRDPEWTLFKKGDYKALLKKTRGAKDEEGMFLEAYALFMIYGAKKEAVIVKNLSKLTTKNSKKNIRLESHRLLGMLNFELGKYNVSLDHLKQYTRFLKEKNIDSIIYYMLIVNNKYMGDTDEEQRYLAKLKLFHPESKLLDKF